MSDINKLFDQFPDYDVFTGKTKAPKRQKRSPRTVPPEPVVRSGSDYGDGFGKAIKTVKVKSASGSNVLTLFYFPILIL